MMRPMLRAKIHGATVTAANLHYEGSITIDAALMDAAGLLVNEKVHVLNLANGTRAETYVIQGERNKGDTVMNGAIARLAQVGDTVIILAYALMNEDEAQIHKPLVIRVDGKNQLLEH